MKIKLIPFIAFLSFCLFSNSLMSQEADSKEIEKIEEEEAPKKKSYKKKLKKKVRKKIKKKKYKAKKKRSTPYKPVVDENFYSVFTDFRIPVRENINESDLRYEGWKTYSGTYAFRCKNEKRVRLTYWFLDKDGDKDNRSEFINVTPHSFKCLEDDIKFKGSKPPRKKRKSRKKQKEEEVEEELQDIETTDEQDGIEVEENVVDEE